MMWGVNALNHGHSLAAFVGDDLAYYFSGPEDQLVSEEMNKCFLVHGGPKKIFWYENPWKKKFRQVVAGQWEQVFDLSVLPKNYIKTLNLDYAELIYTPHHASHAAAGFYTSPFNRCAIVVLDAIGEFECASIWLGENDQIKKVWSKNYPNSLGLFYSAFTKLIGYTPIFEEHKLQEDSHFGNPQKYYDMISRYFSATLELNTNFHRGVQHWPFPVNDHQTRCDIAAAVQKVFEEQVDSVMGLAKRLTGSDSLVYMGGCAMNSRYNKQLQDRWQRVWSLPNPGDASSSIGAVLYHTKKRINVDLGIVKHLDIRV